MKRYDHEYFECGSQYDHEMVESADGEWVRYDDVERFRAELRDLAEYADELKALVAEGTEVIRSLLAEVPR